jgi:hypothetical protein
MGAECDARWLPVDESADTRISGARRAPRGAGRGRPLLPGMLGAPVRPRGPALARHPCGALWRQLAAKPDQTPLLVQEAGAVGSQLLGDELAWKRRLRRRRRSGSTTRSRIHTHLVVETVETPVVEPQAQAGLRAARSADFTTLGRVWGHPNGGRAEKKLVKSANFYSAFQGVRRRRREGGLAVGRPSSLHVTNVPAAKTVVRASRILRSRSADSSPKWGLSPDNAKRGRRRPHFESPRRERRR